MRNIWTIARREYNHYFGSPMAFVIAFLFLSILAIIFVFNLLTLTVSQFGFVNPPDTRFLTGTMAFLMVLTTPAITMRSLADEVRMGTMELLLTAPVRDYELVIGKWLGAFLFVLTLYAASLMFPLMINSMVTPGIDQLRMLSGYLGLILVTSAFLAIGVGISALYANQMTAFFTTLVVLIVMWWLVGAPANILPGGNEVLRYLDLAAHFYEKFNEGVITLTGLVYYISLTILGLLIGTTAVETRRWR